MAINWDECYKSVLNHERQAKIWLGTELGLDDPSWRWCSLAANYPPRVVVRLGHKPVHDKRRAEAFRTWEMCQTKPTLKYLNEEELQEAGEIVAMLADSLGLRARRCGGTEGEGELVYELKPHYGQWEIRHSKS